MTKAHQKYVYVSYIRTDAETLWKALTSADFTQKYWSQHAIESDWKVGSKIQLKSTKGVTVEGKILAADRPKFLSYSWNHMKEDTLGEPPSTVTFEIEKIDEYVKLTVRHENFPENSKVFPKISGGWPLVISNLKSLLETGKAVDYQAC